MKQRIFTTKEAAEYITKKLLPASAKPLTHRSVARLAKIGKLDGVYMALGDWCIPQQSLNVYIKNTLSTKERLVKR